MAHLQLIVVTPEAPIFDEQIDFVVLPLYDGEIGISPLHAPMIGRLGYGEMRIRRGQETSRWYVDGGFVEVVGEQVSVLTGRAIPAAKLDAEVAGEQLQAARAMKANTPDLLELRDRAEQQARAQHRIAHREQQ